MALLQIPPWTGAVATLGNTEIIARPKTARQRNAFMLTVADRIVIGHATNTHNQHTMPLKTTSLTPHHQR